MDTATDVIAQTLMWILIIGFVIYWIPTFVAFGRNAESKVGIFFLNLLLGWTFIGWVVCFVWSFTSPSKDKKAKQVVNVQNQVSIACGNCSEIIKMGHTFCSKCGEKLQVTIIDNNENIQTVKDVSFHWRRVSYYWLEEKLGVDDTKAIFITLFIFVFLVGAWLIW